MAAKLTSGCRVQTAFFGSGVVVRVTRTGAIVALDRMHGLKVDIPLDQLTASGATSGAEAVDVTHVGDATPSDDAQFQARRSIEALRFGIVPTHSIAQVTLGFPELERWAKEQLPNSSRSRPTVCEVCGPFGTGKSHTMAAIRHVASASGFVTAHVEVDGNGVSLSDPASVLRQLWRTISAQDWESPTPLVDLNLRAIENGNALVSSALMKFDRVRSNLLTVRTLKRINCLDRFAEMMEVLLACGDEVTAGDIRHAIFSDGSIAMESSRSSELFIEPKRLISLRTDERANDFVECLVGYSVLARLAGFQGLVVTIDEFEVEAANLTREKIERLKRVISALASWFGPTGPRNGGALGLFIATVGEEGHLGDAIVDALVSNTSGARHLLKRWSRSDHGKLAERIFALYSDAYALDALFEPSLAAHVQDDLDQTDIEGSGLIRAFIKRFVAELDSAYGPVGA
jgi:hypothetical protein